MIFFFKGEAMVITHEWRRVAEQIWMAGAIDFEAEQRRVTTVYISIDFLCCF